MLSVVTPRIGFATGLEPEGLSRDPEVVRRYREDPYVEDRMSARFAAGLNQVVARVGSAAALVDRPVLLLHGAADPICAPQGSRSFHAGLDPAIASRSPIKLYPELRHEIFQEPEREEIWQEIFDWLKA